MHNSMLPFYLYTEWKPGAIDSSNCDVFDNVLLSDRLSLGQSQYP